MRAFVCLCVRVCLCVCVRAHTLASRTRRNETTKRDQRDQRDQRDLNTEGATVDKVAVEEIWIGLRGLAVDLKDVEQVVILSVHLQCP